MNFNNKTFRSVARYFAVFLSVFTVLSAIAFLSPLDKEPITAEANSNCTNATATTPTWNPFPLNLNDPNPQPNGPCTDIPMISHWPIRDGNPRVRNYNAGDTVTAQLYYNNGARVDAANNIMNNPKARLELTQVNATQYRLRSYLSGAQGSANSSQTQYGGDITINIPNNTTLQPIRRQTLWYPQAAQRKAAFDAGQNVQISRNIDTDINVENPLVSANGYQFYTPTQSNIAQQEAPGLKAGFDDSGYFLTAWNVVASQAPVNNPPQLPGQEITIVRGNSGSFEVLNGTDPDNDVPLTYTPNNLPSFCTYNATTKIISCQTNAQTPVRTTFTVTPVDSKGLAGTPGTFIVNVIEPEVGITKVCVKATTTTPCNQAGLQKGEKVTYTITIRNNATAPANNAVVTDDYDQNLIETPTDVNPAATSTDTNNGVLTWNVGTINTGETKTFTYNAVIKNSVSDGAVVKNIATVRADGLEPKQAQTEFPVGLKNPILATSDKVCFKRGTSIKCSDANLTIGDQVTYFINVRNTGAGPAKNVAVVDTYDKAHLTSIANIQPNGTSDTNAGTITWQLGTINAGETRTLSFEATIAQNVTNGQIIINTARITADDLPPQTVTVQFPVGIPTSVQELDRTGGIAIFLLLMTAGAAGAGYYYYQKTNKLAPGFVPSRSSEMSQAKVEEGKKITKKITKKK